MKLNYKYHMYISCSKFEAVVNGCAAVGTSSTGNKSFHPMERLFNNCSYEYCEGLGAACDMRHIKRDDKMARFVEAIENSSGEFSRRRSRSLNDESPISNPIGSKGILSRGH